MSQLVPTLPQIEAFAISQKEGIDINTVYRRHEEKHRSAAVILPAATAATEAARAKMAEAEAALEMKEAELRSATATWSDMVEKWELCHKSLSIAADQFAIIKRELAELEAHHVGGLSWGAAGQVTGEIRWMYGSFELMAGMRAAIENYPKFKDVKEVELRKIEQQLIDFTKKWPETKDKLPFHIQQKAAA